MSDEKRDLMDGAAEKAAGDMADGRGEGRGKRSRKKKVSFLTVNKIDHVDYKDVAMLKRFLTPDRGKIQPARQSGNNARQQRMVTSAIKRAREMALLPFVLLDTSDERRPQRESRPPREPQA